MKFRCLSLGILRILFSSILSCAIPAGTAYATPSTIVWIPSVDIQPFKTFHLNIDGYVRSKKESPGNLTGAGPGGNLAPMYMIGPTVGISPFDKIKAEVGFDLIYGGTNTNFGLDKYPFYGHAKIGTPEDNTWKPAVAVGIYNVGAKSGDARKGELATDQDIAYVLVGKTLPVVGRLSAGGYIGNKKALVTDGRDPSGYFRSDEKGVLLSWDRTMSEISDKLWLGVDYMSGRNVNGALSFGAAWSFAKNVSVIVGYDIWNNRKVAGENTFTAQVDINFP